MKIYQTDFSGEIRDYGCLFMSLINIASKVTGKKIRKHDVEVLYTQLIKDGCMNYTCYVKNHETVLNLILNYLGSELKMVYSGAQYLQTDDSWGNNCGQYIIYQVKAPKFSHFRMMDYDSWRGGLKYNSVLSVRYYTIK